MRKIFLSVMAMIGLATLLLAPSAGDGARGQDSNAAGKVSASEIEALVKQLGSDSSKARESASLALLKIGIPALPFLEARMKTGSLELRRRAEVLYEEIFAQIQNPKLPEGVIFVKLPPGEVRIEDIRDGRTLLRVTVGKTIVEARTVYLGDGKGATRFDAMKGEDAIKGGGAWLFLPGNSINDEGYVPVDKLKPGSIYLTTPSIIFRWGKDAIPPKR